ncbi:protein CNPPD1 [Topomyia yanbarensis]|uniref:protein CNPPD1 n=1 Tax=Topomyia yanbarensis TaxID=2498891 RepID=UPI00273A8C98|nr:protein CNPPD1 [Topomyia yanbarensis]
MIEHEQSTINITDNKAKDHEEFLNRIKKTLYYGTSTIKCTKISRPLADYAADIFSESHRGHSLSRLNFVTVGNMTVTPCSLILAMIYLDRLNTIDPAYARRITPSELFIVSMMVSTKFYCGYDEDIYLSAWADSGSMSIDHMKALELEFLDAIGWEVYVSNHDFFEKLKSVEKVLAKRQGLARGWLTYTELINFLPTMTLAKQILNYSTVIALSYTASVMTIAGAFFLASNINVPGNLLFRADSTQSAVTTESMAATGVVSEPSTLGQNCTLQQSPSQAFGLTLSLEDCECSLQMAIESAQLLGRVNANNNAKFEPHHHKADFSPLPILWFAPQTTKYGVAVNWKHYRFMYPATAGTDDDDDDNSEAAFYFNKNNSIQRKPQNRNCTYNELQSPLILGAISQCATAEIDQQQENRVYTSYKRTFEMFSSFLKFL